MVEKYLELIDSKTAAFTSDVVTLGDLVPRDGDSGNQFFSFDAGTRDAYVDFDSPGGAKLIVEGSLGAGSPFQTIREFFSSGIFQIAGYPRLRLRLDSVSSGTHSAGIFGEIVREGTLIQALTDLNLTTNLQLCLDAGDANSYTSGQKWLDTSGNGYDFFLGVDGSSSGDDPTFNGVAGGLSADEYFSFDGGDYFTYDAANETWMNDMHKNGHATTVVALAFLPSTGNGTILGSAASASEIGMRFTMHSSGRSLQWEADDGVPTGVGHEASILTDPGTLTQGAWNFLGVSYEENGGDSSFFYANGDYGTSSHTNANANTFDGNYEPPSSSNATRTLQIGASGGSTLTFVDQTRLAMLSCWDKALSKAELDSLHAAVRHRVGI